MSIYSAREDPFMGGHMKLFRTICLAILLKCSYVIAIPIPEPYNIPDLLPKELPSSTIKFIEESIRLKHYKITNLGGLTNHNYLIKFEDNTQYVAKIHNQKVKSAAQIEHEIANQKLAHAIGIAPKIVFSNQNLAIIEYLQSINSIEITERDLLDCLNVITLLHDSSASFRGIFNYKDKCMYYLEILKMERILSDDTRKFIFDSLSSFEKISKTVPKRDISPCHNDLNFHNFIASNKGMRLIDWEDSSMNDPAWDISYFLLINFIPENLEKILLKNYLSQRGLESSSFEKRVKLYRPFVLIQAGLSLLASASSKDLEQEELNSLINMCFQNAKKIYFNQRYQDYLVKYIAQGEV